MSETVTAQPQRGYPSELPAARCTNAVATQHINVVETERRQPCDVPVAHVEAFGAELIKRLELTFCHNLSLIRAQQGTSRSSASTSARDAVNGIRISYSCGDFRSHSANSHIKTTERKVATTPSSPRPNRCNRSVDSSSD